MKTDDTRRLDLEPWQKLFIVVGGEGADARMMTDGDNLVAFESILHAGSLVHDLETIGITARTVTMPLEGLYYLSEGMDLGLWVLRHDGTINSIEEIIFP
jgi:hypothetical protein